MGKYDGATVEIINWSKFNPRKDVKAPSWFRMDHGLFENPELYDFSQGEILTWMYLLCIVSKKGSGSARLNYSHAERIGRLKAKDIESALEKLQSLQIVHVDVTCTVRGRNVVVTDVPATDGRTDETDTETSGVPPVISELQDPLAEEILRNVKPEVQTAWLQTYDDAGWVIRECKLAATWCRANPSRKPKSDWAKFMNGWLARNWERRRKTLGPGHARLEPKALEAL